MPTLGAEAGRSEFENQALILFLNFVSVCGGLWVGFITTVMFSPIPSMLLYERCKR